MSNPKEKNEELQHCQGINYIYEDLLNANLDRIATKVDVVLGRLQYQDVILGKLVRLSSSEEPKGILNVKVIRMNKDDKVQ